jgi:DNA-directed RNA polymerase specialized sigma24 family protein
MRAMDTLRGASSPSVTPPGRGVAHPSLFPTTHWSVVLMAGHGNVPQAGDALEILCQTYWHPLYVYVRRRGYSEADAKDLTQGFFAWLLKRNWLGGADQQRGRFRSFLQVSFNRYLANEWDKAQTQKRGGGRLVPLDFEDAEMRCARAVADHLTPEQSYEWRWALTLLDHVLSRLGTEYAGQGKADLFGELKPCLLGECAAQPYAILASKLGMTEGSVKVAVHRLRQKYRQLLRDEVANTVANPGEVDDEMLHLFAVLARR